MYMFYVHYLDLSANINYTIMLDAKRQKYRAYFSPQTRILSKVVNIKSNAETCRSHRFFIDVSLKHQHFLTIVFSFLILLNTYSKSVILAVRQNNYE